MTRVQIAAAKVKREEDKLAKKACAAKAAADKQAQEIKKAQKTLHTATTRALNKRRYRVGALADEAELFTWDDATLSALFHLLAALKDSPHPVAVLEGLLGEVNTPLAVGLHTLMTNGATAVAVRHG
jgi:hypothetical protein